MSARPASSNEVGNVVHVACYCGREPRIMEHAPIQYGRAEIGIVCRTRLGKSLDTQPVCASCRERQVNRTQLRQYPCCQRFMLWGAASKGKGNCAGRVFGPKRRRRKDNRCLQPSRAMTGVMERWKEIYFSRISIAS